VPRPSSARAGIPERRIVYGVAKYQQLFRIASSDTALSANTFEAQVHTRVVLCAFRIYVHKDEPDVVASARVVSELNFIKPLTQMLNVELAVAGTAISISMIFYFVLCVAVCKSAAVESRSGPRP